MNKKREVLILDVKPFIDFFSNNGDMFWLYKQVPLNEIIKLVFDVYFDLRVEHCPDVLLLHTHNLWPVEQYYKLEKGRSDELSVDERLLEFYSVMLEMLGDYLYTRNRYDIDPTRFELKDWLDSTSIILLKY